MMGREGAQAPSNWCSQPTCSPPPVSLGAASPENEPEALWRLLYSVLVDGHPGVLEPQIQV